MPDKHHVSDKTPFFQAGNTVPPTRFFRATYRETGAPGPPHRSSREGRFREV